MLAKALYDNIAESADELAFRKGDIVTVMDQSVAGTSGWWMCTLYGRNGLAPANRLQLLPQIGLSTIPWSNLSEKPTTVQAKSEAAMQNIYQIPSVPRPCTNQTYERMDMIYKVPLLTSSASKGPVPTVLTSESLALSTSPIQVYDVPSQARTSSLFTGSRLMSPNDLEKRLDSPRSSCGSADDSYVYAVPPPLHQDPNYDIPVPAATEAQQQALIGYNTLPSPRKPEWIYDVPVGPEKQSSPQGTMPSKAVCRQLFDNQTGHCRARGMASPTSSLYDVPKTTCPEASSPPKLLPRVPIYDKPPTQRLPDDLVGAVPPQGGYQGDHLNDHIPLECRGDSSKAHELKRIRLQRMRNFLACTSFHNFQGSGDLLAHDESEQKKNVCLPAEDSQRISTASVSSTSSCDSLALSSSSPEPLREVRLGQDEASRRLLELQEAVCTAVPRLMEFVSSHWRSRGHLEKHLREINKAADGITQSLACFLNFALDIKGNARRLTDSNLQARLNKQLSIVEDSGVILQQTVSALNSAGWPLDKLCQDPGQVQTPDQLERFVMVARTVPEDVKRLVSIINANGKLLFKPAQKDPERPANPPVLETNKNPVESKPGNLDDEADNDYVQLQTKDHFETQHRTMTENITIPQKTQSENQRFSSESGTGSEESRLSSLSEHCRLYFGALQKAIGGFVGSLQDGQPPEKFISQSKLVIMVGQRLVNTLCTEAQRGRPNQSLLCKSNHLCALLKQLAVATKKAALHFPEKKSLCEAQEFAIELAQRAQHFRMSLDI